MNMAYDEGRYLLCKYEDCHELLARPGFNCAYERADRQRLPM
jgi:hypothetical protein